MKKILVILGIGCGVFLCLGVVVAGLILFSAAKQATQQEFSPLNATPQTTIANTQAPQSSGTIPDLAYIRTMAAGYSDDADPEPEGISIDITYYDTSSQAITFRDVPLKVHIILNAYRDPLDLLNHTNAETIYDGVLTLDHSMRLGEMFGKYIRIPFGEIDADPSRYQPFGTLDLTVDTPQQGSFTASQGAVPIYAYSP